MNFNLLVVTHFRLWIMQRNNPSRQELADKFDHDVKLEGTRRFCELIIHDLDIQILRVDRL